MKYKVDKGGLVVFCYDVFKESLLLESLVRLKGDLISVDNNVRLKHV